MSSESWVRVVEKDASGVIASYKVRTLVERSAPAPAPDDADNKEAGCGAPLRDEAPEQAAADDWVAVLTERLRDCPGVVLVAPDTKRQQVESRWTHDVFLVERTEDGFRWSQRGGTGLGWIAAPRVLATLDEVCQKMSIANGVEAELAKSKPPGKPAVSHWQHRAERLNDHLVGLMRSATQRLHDDLCAEEFDLDEVAARAADIAETLRVLAEA